MFTLFAIALPLILLACRVTVSGPDTGYKDNNYGE